MGEKHIEEIATWYYIFSTRTFYGCFHFVFMDTGPNSPEFRYITVFLLNLTILSKVDFRYYGSPFLIGNIPNRNCYQTQGTIKSASRINASTAFSF